MLTRDEIGNERRVKLAFEGLRFNDLKRWGIAHLIIPTIPGNGANVKRVFDGYFVAYPAISNGCYAGRLEEQRAMVMTDILLTQQREPVETGSFYFLKKNGPIVPRTLQYFSSSFLNELIILIHRGRLLYLIFFGLILQ